MPDSMAVHKVARRRTRRVIEKMYVGNGVGRITKDEREAILKGVESALRDYERSFPHQPKPL